MLIIFAFPIFAFAGSEVHITKDGIATMNSVTVMQQAGPTFYTRLYWGDSFVRVLVKTNNNTKFFRSTGEPTTILEISNGNLLDIVGELESGTNGLTLVASIVKNSSVQKQQASFTGKVTNVDLALRQFVLDAKVIGLVTVQASSTTVFTKGSRTLDLEHVKVGDTIIKASGDYDLSTKILQADSVKTFVDPNFYKPKTFEGKLVEVISTTSPASLKVSFSGINYLVNLNDKTLILNKARNSVSLSRFVVGDAIRVYGAIQEVDEPIINSEIVRNTSI